MCGHCVVVFPATWEATHCLQRTYVSLWRVGTVNVLDKELILAEDSPHVTVWCITFNNILTLSLPV